MAIIKEYLRDGRAPVPEKEIISKIMSSVKSKNTKPELILRNAIWHDGIKGYRLHWKKVPGCPDISFPGKKVAVFVNGCFWHRCPYCKPVLPKSHYEFWKEKFEKNIERDKLKLKQLCDLNWKTIVIWECQIKKDLKDCIDRIKELVLTN